VAAGTATAVPGVELAGAPGVSVWARCRSGGLGDLAGGRVVADRSGVHVDDAGADRRRVDAARGDRAAGRGRGGVNAVGKGRAGAFEVAAGTATAVPGVELAGAPGVSVWARVPKVTVSVIWLAAA